jgi:hypothetical protein
MTNVENDKWVIQVTCPWMNDQDPNNRPQRPKSLPPPPIWRKQAAKALAFQYMRELGPTTKARIFNIVTHRYEAYVPFEEGDTKGMKVYHGRDADHRPF